MAMIKKMMRECPTIKSNDQAFRKKKRETNDQIKQVMERRKKFLKEDMTKIATH